MNKNLHKIPANIPIIGLKITKFFTLVALLTAFCALALTKSAYSKESLTVYTYESFSSSYGVGPKLKDLFEKQCQCNLKYVSLSDANLILTKVLLEETQTKADLILGIDNNLLKKAEDTGLFAPHGITLPKEAFDIKDELKSKSFLPFDYGWLAFVYSTKNSQNLPKNLQELINSPKDEKFLVIQDPRTSSPGISFVSWLDSLYPKNLKQVIQKIDQKTITYPKGWSEAYSMFLDGKAKMVFSYVTSPLYHILMEDKHHIKTWDEKAPKYLQVEYAGILKTSKNLKLSKQFLKFLISKPAQSLIPKNQWMYPIIKNAEITEFTKAKPAKTIWPKKISPKKLDELIDTWTEAVNSNAD